MEITEQLAALVGDITAFKTKATEEQKTMGSTLAETKATLDGFIAKLKAVQDQADAIDLKLSKRFVDGSEPELKSMGQCVIEDESFSGLQKQGFPGLLKSGFKVHMAHGPLRRKSNITDAGLGFATSGVLMPQRLPGVTGLARQGFRIRDLILTREQTTGSSFDFIKQNTRTNATSPQQEAATKAESTYNWTTGSDQIRTIAHFTNVSRQALDDNIWLRGAIDGELLYGLQLKEEQEILSGDGTGVHLNGILTQASAYSAATYDNVSSYTRLDQLRNAKLQARLAGLALYAPDCFVLNPVDMAAIELIKDESGGVPHKGRYIIGDPKTGAELKFVWGVPAVESDTIAAGTFLVGSFGTGAVELVDRMQATIDISFEHNQNYTQNLATILCEERVGLAVRVPGAFIKGTFASSPA